MDLFFSRYHSSNWTKALQKTGGFFFFYYIDLSHACYESAKNVGKVKINYFLWCCGIFIILFLVAQILTTRCQGLDLVMGLTRKPSKLAPSAAFPSVSSLPP